MMTPISNKIVRGRGSMVFCFLIHTAGYRALEEHFQAAKMANLDALPDTAGRLAAFSQHYRPANAVLGLNEGDSGYRGAVKGCASPASIRT